MSNIYSNQGTSIKANQGQVLSDLSKLEKELMTRRNSITEHGEIMMIEEALSQVKAAQTVALEATNSRMAAGIERDPSPTVQGMALARGEKFTSYNGHGNSYIGYMKANLNGLEDLISSKGIA